MELFKLSLKDVVANLQNQTCTLDSAGQVQSFTVPEYNCPECHNIGWVYPKNNAVPGGSFNLKAVPCRCKKMEFKERRYQAMMKFCNLPDDADHLTFESFKVSPELKEAYESALKLINGDYTFLTLIGDVNKGKTHLAVAVCKEYINVNIPAKYVFTPIFLDELRDAYNKDAANTFMTIFNRYCQVPLLVLDDIYREKTTEWGEEKLTSLVNSRYMDRKPTIFTSNKPLASMCDAIQSRLQRERWCKVVII